MNPVWRSDPVDLLVFLDECNEGRPFDLDGLTRPVVQRDDEMEEIWLSQVRWGLFFKVSPTQTWRYPENEGDN